MSSSPPGTVRFVGAGPGDPALLTVRADSLLRTARVILHDDLVASEILALASPEAVVLNVGKRCGAKRITQSDINALMIGFARRGADVIRLKSGDPAIFGRLAEEIDALSAAGISFEIVPGVSAGLAAAASLGISLTDRRLSSRVVFASAHRAPASQSEVAEDADWRGLAREDATLVIYMPGRDIAHLQRELLNAGLAPDTPAIIVSRASTPSQREHRATLSTLSSSPAFDAPSILLIGRAVAQKTARDSQQIDPAAATSSAWEEFLELLAPGLAPLAAETPRLEERTNSR
ncbi:MAG TPA: uroporphyrinogen-III C-methyltransferase [Candidatus Acidoferrum sp.]|nr:uroporphyrinogen-III C-methyltransferase [Candidatus Acidoferrum sp.]